MRGLRKKEFEKIVREGIKAIPEKFLRKLDNVEIVIDGEPIPARKKKLGPRSNQILFGLYEGVPQLERGTGYTAVLPDKITIFQKPIEAEARNKTDIRKIVKDTIWHEIAHHFGMDEADVRRVERKNRQKLKVEKKMKIQSKL